MRGGQLNQLPCGDQTDGAPPSAGRTQDEPRFGDSVPEPWQMLQFLDDNPTTKADFTII